MPLHLEIWSHSPDGFNWGYGGSGPAQLALALLAEVTDLKSLAIHWHQRFKWEIVGRLPRGKWKLKEREILDWIMRQCEVDLGLVADFALMEDPEHA